MSYILNYHDSDKKVDFADGAYIVVNGKKCLDLALGSGTHILGHRPLIKIYGGTLYGRRCDIEDKYGKLLNEYTGFEKFVLCNTGAEATMRAARIARAYTRREKIAMFEGGWHGCCDTFLDCKGIPKNVTGQVDRLPYDTTALDMIEKGNYAMVIVEPVQGSLPNDNRWFLKSIQDVCKNTKTLFCLDEVVTGFRLSRGGGKELFSLSPDLCTYGKIAGGGLPIGIVGGNEVMDVCLDDVRMGGTFSGNPATLTCGYDVLSALTNKVYVQLNTLGRILRDSVDIPIVGVGSFNRVLFTDKPVRNRKERDTNENQNQKEMFYKEALRRGIHIGNNGLQFLSICHTEDEIRIVANEFNKIWRDCEKKMPRTKKKST